MSKKDAGVIEKVIQTPFQQILYRETPQETVLFLDGDLQFSSIEDSIYSNGISSPALSLVNGENLIGCILGGGDGLLAAKLLSSGRFQKIILCEIDEEMLKFCSSEPGITAMNSNVFADERLQIEISDAFEFIANHEPSAFDLVFADFPDPHFEQLSQLYSIEMYTGIKRTLKPHGIFTTLACERYITSRCFECIGLTARQIFHSVCGYSLSMPTTYGEIGLFLCTNYGYTMGAIVAACNGLQKSNPLPILSDEGFEGFDELNDKYQKGDILCSSRNLEDIINTVANKKAFELFRNETEESGFYPGITNRQQTS